MLRVDEEADLLHLGEVDEVDVDLVLVLEKDLLERLHQPLHAAEPLYLQLNLKLHCIADYLIFPKYSHSGKFIYSSPILVSPHPKT